MWFELKAVTFSINFEQYIRKIHNNTSSTPALSPENNKYLNSTPALSLLSPNMIKQAPKNYNIISNLINSYSKPNILYLNPKPQNKFFVLIHASPKHKTPKG